TSASPELMDIFNRAVDRAEAANSRTYLAHVIDLLLDDSTIRSRIPEKVRIKSHAALAEQTLKLTDYGNGSFAFRFAPLIEPARQLARDWGAERVLPLNFLATCLTAGIPLDPDSVHSQEALRSAGLTLETLVPAKAADETRRQDFTFKSLGFG